ERGRSARLLPQPSSALRVDGLRPSRARDPQPAPERAQECRAHPLARQGAGRRAETQPGLAEGPAQPVPRRSFHSAARAAVVATEYVVERARSIDVRVEILGGVPPTGYRGDVVEQGAVDRTPEPGEWYVGDKRVPADMACDLLLDRVV